MDVPVLVEIEEEGEVSGLNFRLRVMKYFLDCESKATAVVSIFPLVKIFKLPLLLYCPSLILPVDYGPFLHKSYMKLFK